MLIRRSPGKPRLLSESGHTQKCACCCSSVSSLKFHIRTYIRHENHSVLSALGWHRHPPLSLSLCAPLVHLSVITYDARAHYQACCKQGFADVMVSTDLHDNEYNQRAPNRFQGWLPAVLLLCSASANCSFPGDLTKATEVAGTPTQLELHRIEHEAHVTLLVGWQHVRAASVRKSGDTAAFCSLGSFLSDTRSTRTDDAHCVVGKQILSLINPILSNMVCLSHPYICYCTLFGVYSKYKYAQ